MMLGISVFLFFLVVGKEGVKPKQACVYEIREEKDDSVFSLLRILLVVLLGSIENIVSVDTQLVL